MREELLRMERVTLMDEGGAVLNNININIYKGEVVGLMCVNARGQEELLGLMRQNTPIHFGRIYFDEALVNNHRHSSLLFNPVEIVEKNSHLVDSLTVADNVLVLQSGFHGSIIHARRLNKELASYVRELGVHIPGGAYAEELDAFDRCVVEILKAACSGKRLIILHSISSFLSEQELRRIHDIMRFYAARGVSFVYVCNHQKELEAYCDRVAVMENGKIQKIVERWEMLENPGDFPAPEYARPVQEAPAGVCAPVLECRNVSLGAAKGLNFSLYPGECLVLLTAEEALTYDLSDLFAGTRRPLAGEVLFDGRALRARPQRSEIAVIDEKPVQRMLFPHMSYLDNLCFTSDERIPAVWRSKRLRKSIMQEYRGLVGGDIEATDIIDLSIQDLYRLICYRVYFQHPRVVVFVKPFSTIDLSLRQYVSEFMQKLRQKGIAVLIVTSSPSGALSLADRVIPVQHPDGVL